VADGPRCVVYEALAGRLTAERRELLMDASVGNWRCVAYDAT